jgi:hypothetical protein
MPLQSGSAAAIALVALAGAAACSPRSGGDGIAAAPSAPIQANAAPAVQAITSVDPAKTGQAFVEELKQNPTLFQKQKEICNGRGAAFQPSVELQAPCAAWDNARSDLEIDQDLRSGGVNNTSSL